MSRTYEEPLTRIIPFIELTDSPVFYVLSEPVIAPHCHSRPNSPLTGPIDWLA